MCSNIYFENVVGIGVSVFLVLALYKDLTEVTAKIPVYDGAQTSSTG